MIVDAEEANEVEIVLFRIADERYGADASQVLRIVRPDAETSVRSALGSSSGQGRALVFLRGDSEAQLRVDEVFGVQTISVDALRRLPSTAGGAASAIGVWLDGDRPVVLIDLLEALNPA